MSFRVNDIEVGSLPETFLAAQLNYLRHYRALMRVRDIDEHGNPCPHLWHWAVMFQPRDLSLVPEIQAGPANAMPRWMAGKTLAVVEEETGDVLATAS